MSKKTTYIVSDSESQVEESVELNQVFAALANQQRLDLLYLLNIQSCSISQLAMMLELSLPAIHKHVNILESVVLISRKKVGNTNFLSLNRKLFTQIDDFFKLYYRESKS